MLYKFVELFLIGVALFLCSSCNIPQSGPAYKTVEKSTGQVIYEEVIEQVEERVLSDKWMEDRIKKKWYEGHEYLLYRGYGGGIVHNPNCPCKND